MENGWVHMAGARHMFSHVWRHGAQLLACWIRKVFRSGQGITGDLFQWWCFKWYIGGIYCQLGDYMPPTTFYGNQKQPF